MKKLAGAGDGCPRQRGGERGRQPGRGPGLRHGLGQQEHIGRPRARQRGHGVHQRLVHDPFHRAHSGEQRVDERALRIRHARIGDGDGDAAADRRRRVRHGAHERGAGQGVGEKGERAPGHDGDDHGGGAHERGERRRDLGRDLRLDRDHHRGDLADRGGGRVQPQARAASAATSDVGCGSSTATWRGESPSASQPSSMALPILPAPTRTMVPDRLAKGRAVRCGAFDRGGSASSCSRHSRPVSYRIGKSLAVADPLPLSLTPDASLTAIEAISGPEIVRL